MNERLGINKRWTTQKAVAERIKHSPNFFGKELVPDPLAQYELPAILKYVTCADKEPNLVQPWMSNKENIPRSSMAMLGGYRACQVLALRQDDWVENSSNWVNYYRIGAANAYFWEHKFCPIFGVEFGKGLRMMSMSRAADMLAVMALLGWKVGVIYQGYLSFSLLNRKFNMEIEYDEKHRRAQVFMLRLFASWAGGAHHQWPSYAYDEPIYENLLSQWRMTDPAALVPLLLAACDRHTHESGCDTTHKYVDFNENNNLDRVPVEILLLFRLREWEGLANPVLDHPLMAEPFHQLLPAQPVPEFDDLMQGVLKRARNDWPDYDDVLSLESLKVHAAGMVS